MTDLTVKLRRKMNAPIEKVFKAWLEPKMLSQFMLPMPGMKNSIVENDPKVGGRFSILMDVDNERIPHTGNYLEIEAFSKIVFTWESPASTDDSVVTLLFEKNSEEETILELTHVRFIDEQRRSNHEGGWGNILDALDQCILKSGKW